MRWTAALLASVAALLAVVVVGPSTENAGGSLASSVPVQEDKYPASCDGKPAGFHVKRAKKLATKGYSQSRLPDKSPMKDAEKRAFTDHKFCVQHDKLRRQIANHREDVSRDYRQQLRMWQKVIALTPYVCGDGLWMRFAIPCHVVECESGFNWFATNGRALGPYQLLGWGAPMPPDTFAKRLRHHEIAASIYGGPGDSDWAACNA